MSFSGILISGIWILWICMHRIFISALFGIYITISTYGAISLLSGQPSPLTGSPVQSWIVWTEMIASIVAWMTAVFWDKKSVPLLLADTKGVHPFNSSSYPSGASPT